MKFSLLLSLLLSTHSQASILPPTRFASCFAVMTELAKHQVHTADAVSTFRRLHAKIGMEGWQSRGLDPVQLGSNAIDPLKFRTARGRLDTIRKDHTTGFQWAADNGVQVRGVEIVGKENIESVLNGLEETILRLNEDQIPKILSTALNAGFLGHNGLGLTAFWYWVVTDPAFLPKVLAAPELIPLIGLFTALEIRDFAKLVYHFDRRFKSSLREMRQRVSTGSETDWYYFGDTVRVFKPLIDGDQLDPESVGSQDMVDLVPTLSELVVKARIRAQYSRLETCLLSTDIVLMPGPEPRLAMLMRTYPKPPPYPVRQAERSFNFLGSAILRPVRVEK